MKNPLKKKSPEEEAVEREQKCKKSIERALKRYNCTARIVSELVITANPKESE